MKNKKIAALLISGVMVLSLTGCSFSSLLGGLVGHEDETEETQTAEPEPETKPETDSADDGKKPSPSKPDDEKPSETEADTPEADHVYKFSETIRPYEDYESETGADVYSYDTVYTLFANDDGSAYMTVEYVYTPDRKYTESYNGRCEGDDDRIDFTYEAQSDYDSGVSYTFELRKGEVESVTSYTYDSMVAEAAGSYTCDDPELGQLTLDVDKNGSASLTIGDGTVYDGYMLSEGTRYNFYAFDDDGELAIDWYVDCSVNGSFSHSPYGNESKIAFNGLYKCTGMLGDFDMTVNEDGSVTATVEVDGTKVDFTGNAYGKYTDNGVDYNNIGDVYLNSEEGYSMHLEFAYMWDIERWNYHGTITKPLAAG